MFTFVDHLKEEVDLQAQTIDGTRFYKVPSGKLYPSITSVTSFYNRDVFIKWRKKVGEEEANRITKESTFRGTRYHDVVEHYIRNGTITTVKKMWRRINITTCGNSFISFREACKKRKTCGLCYFFTASKGSRS